MRNFKRSNSLVVIVTCIVVGLLLFLFIMFLNAYLCDNEATMSTLGEALLISLITIYVTIFATLDFLPPAFDYVISKVVHEGLEYFLIETEDQRLAIQLNFNIVKKNRNYITLDDGFTRIKIAYTKELLKFLGIPKESQ